MTIGGVTVVAIRFGRNDEGANAALLHALTGAAVISAVLCVIGTCLTGPVCRLLGATDTYYAMATDYLFWYSFFYRSFRAVHRISGLLPQRRLAGAGELRRSVWRGTEHFW